MSEVKRQIQAKSFALQNLEVVVDPNYVLGVSQLALLLKRLKKIDRTMRDRNINLVTPPPPPPPILVTAIEPTDSSCIVKKEGFEETIQIRDGGGESRTVDRREGGVFWL